MCDNCQPLNGECDLCPRVGDLFDVAGNFSLCEFCRTAFLEGVKVESESTHLQDFLKGKTRERERIIRVILRIRDNWRKTPSFNYPSELSALVDEIDQNPVTYIEAVQ